MTENNERVANSSNNLVVAILVWLGVLTGAIATMLLLQSMRTTDLKTDLLNTSPYYVVPSYSTIYKPGPDPWNPITVTKPGPDPWYPATTTTLSR